MNITNVLAEKNNELKDDSNIYLLIAKHIQGCTSPVGENTQRGRSEKIKWVKISIVIAKESKIDPTRVYPANKSSSSFFLSIPYSSYTTNILTVAPQTLALLPGTVFTAIFELSTLTVNS